MDILLRVSFAILIYPGLLFLIVLGVLVEGLRRKFRAWSEGRDSPSLLQPWYDWQKLWRKITLVPAPGFIKPDADAEVFYTAENRANAVRLALFCLPGLAIIALVLASALLPLPPGVWPFRAEGGTGRPLGLDLLAVALVLLLPTVVCIILGAIGGSIYSQLAGARTFQLFVGYLAPYVVGLFGPALVLGTLDIATIAEAQNSGALAIKLVCGILFLVAMPAGLRLRPLAISLGEGLEGVTTDLNGVPLALFRLMEIIERVVSGLLFAVIFVPFAAANPVILVGALLFYFGVVAASETLLGQFRLQDTLRFYIMYASPGALLWFVVLALIVKV